MLTCSLVNDPPFNFFPLFSPLEINMHDCTGSSAQHCLPVSAGTGCRGRIRGEERGGRQSKANFCSDGEGGDS